MGNTKFKLSDMIPNAWFYMLKDMSKPSKSSNKLSRKHHPSPPPPPPSSPPFEIRPPQPQPECEAGRKSYHITRELPLSPPRKSKSWSSKSRKSTRRSSSISSCSCKSTTTSKSLSYSPSPPRLKETDENVDFFVEDALLTTKLVKRSILDNALSNRYNGSAEHLDIIIGVDEKSLLTNNQNNNNIDNFNFPLPSINTKQLSKKPKNSIKENKLKTGNSRIFKENKHSPPSSRRFSVNSPGGVRLKLNSPRVTGRKQGQIRNHISDGRRSSSSKKTKKSIAESFAVVKSSRDPQKDFKESMVEMIVQNNIRGTKDLEDLLACYLSLNSDEYHEVIIKVFKQIWFDLRHCK